MSGFSLTPSWDLLVLFVFLGAIFLYGITIGRDRLVILLLSIYFSNVVIQTMPWGVLAKFFGSVDSPSPSFKIFLFFTIIVAIAFLMPRSILGSKFKTGKGGRGSVFYIFIFSICNVGILSTTTLSFLSAKVVNDLNPLIIQLFWGEEVRFFWTLLPILLLILLRPGRNEA